LLLSGGSYLRLMSIEIKTDAELDAMSDSELLIYEGNLIVEEKRLDQATVVAAPSPYWNPLVAERNVVKEAKVKFKKIKEKKNKDKKPKSK